MVFVASIMVIANLTGLRPDGAVLGVAAGPPVAAPLSSVPGSTGSTRASPTPARASSTPSFGVPQLAEDPPVVIAWTDSFNRPRLQIIVPIRNESSEWVHISDGQSEYRLIESGSELASGAFRAVPALVEPGGTAYLVETRDDPSRGRLPLDVETTIVGVRSEEPKPRLALTRLTLDQAIGGGMRASGRVRNDGPGATGRVTVGAVALGEDGRPLGAVLDTHDIVRLPPDKSQSFATDVAAGAPSITAAEVDTVIGVAFEP